MSAMFMLPFDAAQLAIIWLGVTLAYVVFGIAGFGTALIAAPLLAQFMPLSRIVPLLALLDFSAAALNLLREGRRAQLAELRRIVPAMLVGSALGALLLLIARPDTLLLLLGIFVVAYAAYALSGYRPARRFRASLAWAFGTVGGVFSAMFGSGGFIYAIFLAGRLDDKTQIRATQSTLIGLSTLTRLLLFAGAGVYADAALLRLAGLLLPAMLIGVWLGRHITLRLSREQFVRLVNVLVLFSGVAVLVRYFST
ncbi:sulfite exporter TauE/SafE family protein [Chitinasiproducens palmae]|uniref:Probable membrane transporter protein n=1 Tax=Chitinasiproducens palmae TaxID=1770053 RepID=A0A1H2PVK8_9BURK|nr:sulfite exporter TauE/SafE family protein [Chitinasiproducens palmae]SDV50485.1 hypothetical protein SAMN05216551_11221 [Chitinasiproducens palmae]